MRILLGVLLALLIGLQGTWWFGKGGLRDVHKLQAQIAQQQRELEVLQTRNNKLAAEVMDLKQGLDAVEEIARSEMGMIKENEIFYQLIEPKPPASSPQAPNHASNQPSAAE
jgi:cell division protein FtsB